MIIEYIKDNSHFLSAVANIEYEIDEKEIHITFVEPHFSLYGIYIPDINEDLADEIINELKTKGYYDFSGLPVEFYDEEDEENEDFME